MPKVTFDSDPEERHRWYRLKMAPGETDRLQQLGKA
jgi:hypothetical protein